MTGCRFEGERDNVLGMRNTLKEMYIQAKQKG